MVIEARKRGIPFVWAYIVGGFLIAISVTFPPFLIARELRISKTDPSGIRTGDTVLLALVAVITAAFCIWVDVL
jgi:hypothetical protein